MDKPYDAVALGELLVDFTPGGVSPAGNPLFEANPGGAVCNVLAMLAKLGRRTAFIGKVGADMHGRRLIAAVGRAGIDTGCILADASVKTTLAFVQNTPDGDREFVFFREPGADTRIREKELDSAVLQGCRSFHFGSLSLTDEPARGATRAALAIAKAAGALISFDPNLRPALWKSMEEARRQIAWGCGACNVLKVSLEELAFISGEEDLDRGVAHLRGSYPGISMICVTMGKAGSWAFAGEARARAPAFIRPNTVDTTGAGDTFCGCCLSFILSKGLCGHTEGSLREMLLFAGAAAALETTRRGALLSMPAEEEIAALLAGEFAKEAGTRE